MYDEYKADILKWNLWDTLRFEKGRSIKQYDSFKMFETPLNSQKNFFETSMEHGMLLPQPQHFNITHLHPSYGLLNNEYDDKKFKESACFILWVGLKSYAQGPMATFQLWKGTEDLEKLLSLIQHARLLGFRVDGNSLDLRIGNDPIGVHISQKQQFYVEITFQYPMLFRNDWKLTWFLDGVISRGVF